MKRILQHAGASLEGANRAPWVRVAFVLTLALVLVCSPSWAQEENSAALAPTPGSDIPAQQRLDQIREEMVSSLSRLEGSQRELSAREQILEEAQSDLEAAKEADDPALIEDTQQAFSVAEEAMLSLREDMATEQLLYDRAAERFRIAQEQANLAAGDGPQLPSRDGSAPPLLETMQVRGQADQAEQEAALARQRAESLRAEVQILESRQERIRRDSDQINRWLDGGRQLDSETRRNLTSERQRLIDEERAVEDRMNRLRGQLVLAETTQRIKEESAEQELANYRSWRRQLVVSLSLLLTAVLVLLLLRFLVSRYVENPDHRFTLNRRLSLAITLVLMIGLAVIFLRQFPYLITGIGVILAGVAIALQEIILSFFGFFAVRGARGYRIGDWVRIGDQVGEVVDISLLVTILEEVTPIEFTSHSGGTKTGALTWINNNAIFREKMTNYTRGFPYIWTTLTYTITFESNWQHAEELLRQIINSHDEILTTAKLARKRVTEVASDFAIKVDNTAPRVRTWTAASGVELRLRFMVHPRRRRALIDIINREVMEAISEAQDIDFAYDTLRVIPTPTETSP